MRLTRIVRGAGQLSAEESGQRDEAVWRTVKSGAIASKVLQQRDDIFQGLPHFLNNSSLKIVGGDPFTGDEAGLDPTERFIVQPIVDSERLLR